MSPFYRLVLYRVLVAVTGLIVLYDLRYAWWLFDGGAVGHYRLSKEAGLQFVPDPWQTSDWLHLGFVLAMTVGMITVTFAFRRRSKAQSAETNLRGSPTRRGG